MSIRENLEAIRAEIDKVGSGQWPKDDNPLRGAPHTAECLLASTPRKYGLVLGAEILSRVMDFGDRSTCVLFGDGAGAALVEADPRLRIRYEIRDAESGARLTRAETPGLAY